MGISQRSKFKWYLEDVNPRKNIEWTEEERKEVFTLRKKLPAREVARKLKITIIQVYNATRLHKKTLKGQCFVCGNELTTIEKKRAQNHKIKICSICRKNAKNYKLGRRSVALKNNLCVYCSSRPALKGHVSCSRCISATHRRRYREGFCGQCGRHKINYPEESVCKKCAKINRRKAADYRAKKKEQNA